MSFWLGISRAIDRANDWIGRTVSWLAVAMVVVGAYNAIVRYLGRFIGVSLSSNVYIELQWYMFSVLFLLSAAYALKIGAHVRVDVVYARLTPRTRAWINLVGTVIFLIPFSIMVLWVSWPSVSNSWQVLEMSPDPGGLPRYPIKTVILLGFVLLIAQGISELIKQIAFLRGDLTDEPGQRQSQAEGV